MDLKKKLLSFAYKLEASKRYKAYKTFAYDILENQSSLKKKYFDYGMIFLVLSTIMILILEIKNDLPSWVYNFEAFAIFSFILEWLGRFWVSSDGYKLVIKAHSDIKDASLWQMIKPALAQKWRFIISPMSIIDLLAILPSYRPLRVLRFFLLFRLFKVFRYTKSLNFLMHVFVEKRFEFLTLLVIFSFMVFFASTALYIFEGTGENPKLENFFDAIYWAVITITTVGYGDISPQTDEGQFITMVLIIGGIGIISFMTSIMTTAMTQKLHEAKSQYVVGEVGKLKEYILLCGYGKMGKVLAHELRDDQRNILIVDQDEDAVEEAKLEKFLALKADASDMDILKELECDSKVKYAVILSNDDTFNLSATLSLRALDNDIHILSRANTLTVAKKLEIAGASEAIYPYSTAALVAIEHVDTTQKSHKVVIFGYAKTAKEIVKALHFKKEEYLFVVGDAARVKEVQDDGFIARALDLTDDDNLHIVGIGKDVEMLFCVSQSPHRNLFVTLSARNLDKDLKIISLCATEDEASKMKLAGANHTINPYEIGARRISRLIKKRDKEEEA
jgi:voltage-gated potassium channel